MTNHKIGAPNTLSSFAHLAGAAPVSLDLLPNGEELMQLCVICANTYPGWADPSEEWLHQFGRSILALSHMRKLERPDTKRYAHDFVTHAQTLLRSIGRYTKELGGSPFFMACMVMGVPISGLGIEQCTISLGLTQFDGVGSPIDPTSWRVTLKAGSLPTQHRVDRIIEQPSQVTVRYGF